MGRAKASGSKSEGTQQKPLDPKVNERRGGTRLLLKLPEAVITPRIEGFFLLKGCLVL